LEPKLSKGAKDVPEDKVVASSSATLFATSELPTSKDSEL
jgi:hypothetical protein